MEVTTPDNIKWVKNAAGTQETAVLFGDPTKAGPYVIRLRWLPGNMSRPHFHPSDRFFVVVSGTWWVGAGEKYDPESTVPAGPGTLHLAQGGRDPLRRRQEGAGRDPGLGDGAERLDSCRKEVRIARSTPKLNARDQSLLGSEHRNRIGSWELTSSRSPTTALLLGLVITLATVVTYSWYISGQISGLRRLQTELTDRNRRDSLQLLRIQNDLNQLALAMRDMLDAAEPYPLTAWSTQFDRIRLDLDDALKQQGEVALARQTPEQREFLATSLKQFWDAVGSYFRARPHGKEAEARAQIQLSLQARQAALSTAVARLLVQNNEAEEQTAQQVQDIYRRVQRQVYWFLAATLAAIVATSLYLIRSNRRLFARLATLSDERRELAQTLIATRESTLREISRELHDEFGQILTAIGSMLGRAGKHAPEGSTAARRPARDRRGGADGARQRARPVADAASLHPRGAGAGQHDRLVPLDGGKATRHSRHARDTGHAASRSIRPKRSTSTACFRRR